MPFTTSLLKLPLAYAHQRSAMRDHFHFLRVHFTIDKANYLCPYRPDRQVAGPTGRQPCSWKFNTCSGNIKRYVLLIDTGFKVYMKQGGLQLHQNLKKQNGIEPSTVTKKYWWAICIRIMQAGKALKDKWGDYAHFPFKCHLLCAAAGSDYALKLVFHHITYLLKYSCWQIMKR